MAELRADREDLASRRDSGDKRRADRCEVSGRPASNYRAEDEAVLDTVQSGLFVRE